MFPTVQIADPIQALCHRFHFPVNGSYPYVLTLLSISHIVKLSDIISYSILTSSAKYADYTINSLNAYNEVTIVKTWGHLNPYKWKEHVPLPLSFNAFFYAMHLMKGNTILTATFLRNISCKFFLHLYPVPSQIPSLAQNCSLHSNRDRTRSVSFQFSILNPISIALSIRTFTLLQFAAIDMDRFTPLNEIHCNGPREQLSRTFIFAILHGHSFKTPINCKIEYRMR